MKTFKTWNSLGYKIHKGAKATKFNKNKQPLFASHQVYKYDSNSRAYPQYYDREDHGVFSPEHMFASEPH